MPHVASIGTCLPLIWPVGRSRPAGFTHGIAALPDDLSGELLAEGHPPGATRVAQCVKLSEQVRGTAAAGWVDGARIGLAHNIGGPTAASAVTFLEGPGDDGV
jgi:acetyl-CoA C-acetyltransferase